MNRIYRIVWNQSLGMLVAVAENAKGRGKSGTGRKLVAAALSLTGGLFLLPFAHAGPLGGQVTAGNGTITQAGTNTTINQTSQNLAINWQSFDIGANEAVRFNQPNANSIALNRVIGQDPSRILGSLSANGQVFVVNPNGMLFGASAQVNVGGLVASTLGLSNADFMAGRYSFGSEPGAAQAGVVNQGRLSAAPGGYIALLAPEVRNQGVVVASRGTALLAAGNKVTLNLGQGSLLSYAIDQGALNALADNKQLIQADGGQVILSAKAANALTTAMVNNSGIIQARRLENVGGVIKLMGDMQSGTVRVDGALDASASGAGNGGFVETSAAHVKVADSARVSTLSAQGLNGTWLIDPVDFTIAASGGDMTGAAVTTALGSGNFTIQSTTGAGGVNGDVNVNDAVSWSANKLTLNAQNNINIRADMNASGSASLALQFGQGAVEAGNTSNIITQGGAVNLPASTSNFTTQQGSDGVVKNYTVVNTVAGMNGINNDLSLNYALGANLDATGVTLAVGGTFSGTFDGLGHTVSNLTINSPTSDYVGLFSQTSTTAVIRNLGLVGGSVTGRYYVGGLVGTAAGTISNSYATGSVTGRDAVGGLVGVAASTISNSYATGSVTGTGIYVGGLVGSNYGTIGNSYATGSVTGSTYVGGLTGTNYGTTSDSYATGSVTGTVEKVGGLAGINHGTIINSYATGNATGSVTGNSYVGGLVGGNYDTISNSYATGSVTGKSYVGGLFGTNYGTTSNNYATGNVTGTGNFVGGLVGSNGTTISNSYATGSVTGKINVGGLVGANYGTTSNSYATGSVTGTGSNVGGLVGYTYGTISNSYWDRTTSGVSVGVGSGATAGVTGLTTAEFFDSSKFTGFDFSSTGQWVNVGGKTRPMLRSEYSTSISNAHQLQLMALDLSAHYTLTANIDATQTDGAANPSGMWGAGGFAPIDTFTGSLDGLGQTVSNLVINRPGQSNVGLFSQIGAAGVVRNLGLVGGSVTGRSQVGGLVGLNYGTISNSYATASVTGNDYYSNSIVGGLVGLNYGTISNGYATGNVTGTANFVGGLVGLNEGTISNSYATGSVTGKSYVGGLVGSNDGTTSNNYATGSVTGTGNFVGGLVGSNFGTINNSYATGSVTGKINVGGLVGANYGTTSNSYATGSVTGTGSNVGGLVGNNGGMVSDSYWDLTTSGRSVGVGTGSPAGVTGLTTAQMHQAASFDASWDMAGTWIVYEGHTAPLLRSFMKELTVTIADTAETYTGLAATATVSGVTYSITPDANLLGGTLSYGNAVNAGTYQATGLYSTSQQGYIVRYVGGTLTINKAHLTVTADNQSRTYGAANPTLSQTIAGFVNGETLATSGVTGSATGTTTATASTGVGTVAISANTAGLSAANYDFVGTDGTLTINKAHLTVTADNQSRTYGAANPTLSQTIAGFVNGETLATSGVTGSATGSTTATASTGVGTVAISANTAGLSAANYDFAASTTDGTLTINKAHLTVTANNQTRAFGAANPPLTQTVSGFVNGETLASSGVAGADTSRGTTTANASTGAGIVPIMASTTGLSAANYDFLASTTPGILTITAAPASGISPETLKALQALPGINNSNLAQAIEAYKVAVNSSAAPIVVASNASPQGSRSREQAVSISVPVSAFAGRATPVVVKNGGMNLPTGMLFTPSLPSNTGGADRVK